MEILSTGEKIKRARIYQGITLKELCCDKISISKMSCIENGKIKADEDSLKYISNKLGVDYNYLTQDVYEQIIENLNLLRNNITPYEEREEVVRYNLEYAKENCYYELAFELIHMLFVFYLEENKVENIQLLISDYYDLYQKSNCNVNIITYYEDMATFFRKIKEYNEAINYYSSIRNILEKEEISDKEKYVYTCFFEGVCYKELNLILDSYKCLKRALKYSTYFTNNKYKGLFYHEFALVNILLNKVEADKYVMKAYKFQKEDSISLAKSKGENGKCYFKIFEVDKALIEIEEGIKIFPKENKKEYVDFLINCITTLYENKEFDKAFELTDDALNLAIDVDDIRLIEKAYYFKGMIYQKRGLYRESEMYMNLSTDSLLRFASKEQRYIRYNEMAELYYHLGELKQSINYFTLAVNLEKTI